MAFVRRDPPSTTASRDEVFAVVDAAFAQRRKTLRAALRVLAPVDRVEAALVAAGVEASTRGEQLDVAAFARLADARPVGAAVKGPEVRVTSPAKVNLCLGVGPRREDGYHPLATVYQAIGLFDEVVLRPAEEDTLTVSGDGVDVGAVPTDENNLVRRAVRLLGERAR